MLSLRTTLLSSLCALAFACDAPPPAKQDPAPTQPTPTPAEPTAATPDPAAEALYLKALELEAAGRFVEARAEVEAAIKAGAGRDASLLAAKLAILREDLDTAANLLTPLAAAGGDALVHYNLGLVAQRRNQYNNARSAYLAALKVDPAYAPARFNLAVLTWDAGVREEAQHHARKFLELSPDDPRAAELRTRVELDGAAPPQPPGTSNPGTTPAVEGTARPDAGSEPRDPSSKKDKKKDPGPGGAPDLRPPPPT